MLQGAIGALLGAAGNGAGSGVSRLAGLPFDLAGSYLTSAMDRHNARKALKTLYPGANTHDLLGSAASGSAVSAAATPGVKNQAIAAQERMTKLQTDTQKEVAETNAEATKYAADASADAPRQRVGSEIELNKANTATAKAMVKQIKANVALLNEQERTEFWKGVEQAQKGLHAEAMQKSQIRANNFKNPMTLLGSAGEQVSRPQYANKAMIDTWRKMYGVKEDDGMSPVKKSVTPRKVNRSETIGEHYRRITNQ